VKTQLLPTETFISGNVPFYKVVREFPELRMVPIEHYDVVKQGLTNLGYDFRIRYRGPHRRDHDTLKKDARAFTVYIQTELI
jgi:hypothetical protein